MDFMETIITFFLAYGFIWSVHNKITIDKIFPAIYKPPFFPIWSYEFPLQPALQPGDWWPWAAARCRGLRPRSSCGRQMSGSQKIARKIRIWPEKLRVNSLTYLFISDLTVFRLQTEDSACKHSGNHEDVSNKLMVIFSTSWPSLAILEKSGSIAAQIAKFSDGHPRLSRVSRISSEPKNVHWMGTGIVSAG